MVKKMYRGYVKHFYYAAVAKKPKPATRSDKFFLCVINFHERLELKNCNEKDPNKKNLSQLKKIYQH